MEKPRHIRSLTGMRFIAAMLVLISHLYSVAVLPPFDDARLLLRQGGVGVSFFFILSGFVLAWSHTPLTSAGTFYRRRFARIYPAYVTALGLGLLASIYASLPLPQESWTTVFLVQAWVPVRDVFFAVNVPAWSLSTEAFFYALFPLIIGPLMRLSERKRWVLGAVLITCAFAVPVVSYVLGGPVGYWLHYIFPVTRLPEFILGILVAAQVMSGRWPRVPLWLPFVLVIVAYLGAGLMTDLLQPVVATLLPFLFLIGTLAHSESEGRVTPFTSPSWMRLGAWSYCLYLVHVVVIVAVMETLGRLGLLPTSWIVGVPVALGIVLLSVVAAAGLYYSVERPLERRISGRKSAGRSSTAINRPLA